LRPKIELRQLAIDVLADGPSRDPLLPFSSVCRRDLETVRNSAA
jgi:hypothetical protein